jgi:hypothetical protein
VFVPISSTKTNRLASTCSATITLQAHLKNSSRSSAPIVRFLREAQPPHTTPDGGVARGRARYALQKAASLADGGAWALLYVLFEEDSSCGDLLAEIFGIGSHASMIAYGSTFMLTAVKGHGSPEAGDSTLES